MASVRTETLSDAPIRSRRSSGRVRSASRDGTSCPVTSSAVTMPSSQARNSAAVPVTAPAGVPPATGRTANSRVSTVRSPSPGASRRVRGAPSRRTVSGPTRRKPSRSTETPSRSAPYASSGRAAFADCGRPAGSSGAPVRGGPAASARSVTLGDGPVLAAVPGVPGAAPGAGRGLQTVLIHWPSFFSRRAVMRSGSNGSSSTRSSGPE